MLSSASQHPSLQFLPSSAREHHRSRGFLPSSVSFIYQRNAATTASCGCGTPPPSRRKAYLFHSSTKGRRSICTAVENAAAAPSGESVSEMQTPEVPGQLNKEMAGASKEEASSEGSRIVAACDKLIEVFMVDKPTTSDWRKLLAFSRTWDNFRPHFFLRCRERADAEADPGMKERLLRLGRKLKEIDEDVQRHNELLRAIKDPASNITEIVARRRKDFTREFIEHMYNVANSYYNDPAEQNALEELVKTCVAAVEAYDNASETIEDLHAAELKLQDILRSPSFDAACRKIDELAQKKELDSALMLAVTKAWAGTKDTDIVKDEAKDILYHLYKIYVGNMQRHLPKEVRIIKYLLTIEDPEELLSALKDAFTPGEELEGKDIDYLYTTPEKLFTTARTVVDAYYSSKEGTMIRVARDLMNPKIIRKLEELQKLINDKFM